MPVAPSPGSGYRDGYARRNSRRVPSPRRPLLHRSPLYHGQKQKRRVSSSPGSRQYPPLYTSHPLKYHDCPGSAGYPSPEIHPSTDETMPAPYSPGYEKDPPRPATGGVGNTGSGTLTAAYPPGRPIEAPQYPPCGNVPSCQNAGPIRSAIFPPPSKYNGRETTTTVALLCDMEMPAALILAKVQFSFAIPENCSYFGRLKLLT